MNKSEKLKKVLNKLVFSQTISQEIANSITHGIGALLSIAAIVILINSSYHSGSALKIVCFTIYGFTLLFLFLSSTLYHALRPFRSKSLFLKFDHIAIFFLISGTYTPLVLITIGGRYGWIIFGIVWTMTITGTLFKIFSPGASVDKVLLSIYLAMGWFVVIFIKVLLQRLPLSGVILFFMGGIFYTVGTLFFLSKKMKYSHAIWHLFVLAAATCHFLCILLYVY